MRTDGETCPYWWIWSESIFPTTVAISQRNSSPCSRSTLPSLRMPHVLLKPGGSRLLWSVTGGGKWQPGVGPWHLSEVMEGSRSMEGNVPSFFSLHPTEWWTAAQRSGDGCKSRPESTAHLQRVTLTGPWLTPPPPKFPQRSWKNRLTATSITFSNRCLCSSSALNASP